MSNPVVVKGTAVSAPPAVVAETMSATHPTSGTQIASGTDDRPGANGGPPKTKCNDFVWALLLYGNVAAILAVAVVYGPGSFGGADSTDGFDYTGYVWAGLICAVISVILSGFGLALNMCCPETMIKISLIFVVIMSAVWAVLAFMTGQLCKWVPSSMNSLSQLRPVKVIVDLHYASRLLTRLFFFFFLFTQTQLSAS